MGGGEALLESIFRTNRGRGVGRELEAEEKEGFGLECQHGAT